MDAPYTLLSRTISVLAPTHGMSVNFGLPPGAAVLGLSHEEAALAEGGGEWDPPDSRAL